LFSVEQTFKKEKMDSGHTYEVFKLEGLKYRFFASLIILFFAFVLAMTLYLYPTFETKIEIRIVLIAIIISSLLGFWSIKKEIVELVRILKSARLVTSRQNRDKIVTRATGEVIELVDSFNIIIIELNETVKELEISKQRVESLIRRVGTAISNSGDIDEFLKIILEITTDVFQVKKGFLYILAPDKNKHMFKVVGKESEVHNREKKAVRDKMEKIIENAEYYEEGTLLAIPLIRGKKKLGALALEKKDSHLFQANEKELLQDITMQIALALEANQLRESEERTYFETISALALAIEARDPYTRGHSQRTATFAVAIGKKMGVRKEDIEIIRSAAILHDIGKVGIPDTLLRKKDPLIDTEYEIIKKHPEMGEHIVKPLKLLNKLVPAIRNHHEQVDGKGYPDGLSGQEIDMVTATISVADALDAMLSERPYRTAYPLERAVQEIRKGIGIQFHSEVAKTLLELIESKELDVEKEYRATTE